MDIQSYYITTQSLYQLVFIRFTMKRIFYIYRKP